MAPKGPYKLVTVNTAPERAKRLVGRVVEELKDRYTIEHVANCETEEADQILSTARSLRPGIKTYAIPHGLQVERGPDAVVEHLLEKVPQLLES
ncbi:uncharacterized protein ColSpa_01747 [Colletotrichum spaethianum]|uniref:Uncharacterized protein n=1 Tax=Colletotrichum spaethianum TaxID=700344 RepID=A0AA37L4G2_9PEZI|nr:uncharacterized protein ColSpa_01747 [Colletotrichum spaethianum]GKT41566.1 hypothetical protein ColSpa_01747 [Colletotrichum spaethianum]